MMNNNKKKSIIPHRIDRIIFTNVCNLFFTHLNPNYIVINGQFIIIIACIIAKFQFQLKILFGQLIKLF